MHTDSLTESHIHLLHVHKLDASVVNKTLEDADAAVAAASSSETVREQSKARRARLLGTYEELVRNAKATVWREFQQGVTITGGEVFFAC